MKLSQIAAVVLAIVTMGFVAGGAAAMIVHPGPVPTTVPFPTSITYTVTVPVPGALALFLPYFVTVAHPGLVQVHLLNQDGSQHAYVLAGSGMVLNAPPHGSLTMLVYLGHSGTYAWINLIPYPGVPAGVTVGTLIVR
jgi:hypothetical protein